MEAARPARTLPSKEELLAFQARWMRPAGVCAILGALIFAASLPLQPSTSGDTDAERLPNFHEQSTDLIVGQGVLIGIAVLLFIPLLYVLIRSVVGRTERVRRGMISLAFVGPILFSASGLIVAIGLADAADEFVEQAPAKERQAREQAVAAQAAAKGAAATQSKPAPNGQTSTATEATTTQPTTTSGTSTAQSTSTTTRTPDQAASKARDDLADHVLDDSGLLQAGSLVRFVGLLTLVFAMIYIPLWSLRTGLLTRFWAMLGLALGISLLLIPVGIFGLMFWFAVVGLMVAGWWPATLPPAWAEGRAIPWPGREDVGPPPGSGDPGTVEGSGRELAEQPLPEEGGEGGEQPPGETQGRRRKKRKRRR